MSKIISYMQELGLTDLNEIERYFLETDIDTIKTFDEYISNLAFDDWQIAEYSPYLFVPSIDLSGFGGCGEVQCKMNRAFMFDKFASLYSDVVYLFVESITVPHRQEVTEEIEFQYRYNLMCDFSLIYLYSNLIKRNIARIIPPHFSVCPECFAKHVCDEKQLTLLEPLVQEYSAKAIIEAIDYNKKENIGSVRIKNLPEMFPNHDAYVLINSGEGLNILKAISSFPSTIKDNDFVKKFIKGFVNEQYKTSKFETFMSSTYQSKFITAKPSDKMIIDTISKNIIGTTAAHIFEMPFFKNIDTETLLKLRETEYHAFNDYRIALDKATKAYSVGQKPVESKEIYDDFIYPAFAKLDAMFERTKKMRALKALGELVIISSTVTLGVMNSLIPANPVSIITALGGTGVLVKQISGIVERKLLSENELEATEFYFLWKLKKESE